MITCYKEKKSHAIYIASLKGVPFILYMHAAGNMLFYLTCLLATYPCMLRHYEQ